MDVRPTGFEGIPPGLQESNAPGRSSPQLKRKLGNIDNADEPLSKITKEENSSSLDVVKQPDATALLETKRKLEERWEILQKKIEININLTGEYIENEAGRDAQLAYLNVHNLNEIKEVEGKLAGINKQLSKLEKEDASSRSGR